MLKAGTHLHFDGHCLEAFNFYAKCLGGKVEFAMTWGESPAAKQVPSEWGSKMIHARLEFGDQFMTGDDAPPGRYAQPQGFEVMLLLKSPAEAEKTFNALAQGATEIRMPFAKTFWSPGFGMLVDRFGTPWMINCEPK